MPRSNARHIIVKDGKPAKSTKPRTVKTSKQAHRPFTLTNPVIMKETGEIDDVFTRKVIEELWSMHDAMVKNEEHYYNDGFLKILEEYAKIDDPKRARGKKNSALRGIIDKPAVDLN